MEIRVFKSKRQLQLWQNNQLLKSYPVGIGKSELGHKEKAGDFRTPEGEYEICVKNPKSKFYLSLGLNYPNQRDAEYGLTKGLISPDEFQEISIRVGQHKGSLWSTKLGGAIYIHGDLESQTWSEGCVRMFNADIESLFPMVSLGTRVLIYP